MIYFPEQLAEAIDNAPSWMTVGSVADNMPDAEQVASEVISQERWSVVYRAVYRHAGRYWAVEYDEPATENQEIDNSEYTVYEVTPITRTIIDYARLDQLI